MKTNIVLSGYADDVSPQGEDNLVSLKNPVPNGDYHYFGLNPIVHDPNARRTNDTTGVSGIKRRKKKKKEVEATVDLSKPGDDNTVEMTEDGDGLGHKEPSDHKNVLPNGADMYYGLIPIEHAPISQMVISAEFGSRFPLYAPVWVKFLTGVLPAQILAVTFMTGKVLYTVAVYTGFPDSETYKDQYGLLNTVGWDENGREYVRVSNLDSTFVEPREIPLEDMFALPEPLALPSFSAVQEVRKQREKEVKKNV